jgi:CMP-N,N'-diacetyllegionaminic acid synthase
MKILAIIPARGGSKGVPGKNIKLLGEKPLLQYTVEASMQSQLISKTILSTDDAEIIACARNFDIEIPFVRPHELATDQAKSIDVVKHAVEFMEAKGEFYDAVCLLQVTSPFRPHGMIDKAIQKFIDTDADTLITVLPVPHEYNPHWVFEVNERGELKIATGENTIISRRQDLPLAYHRDGSIYITKTEYIKQGTFYGNSLTYLETDPNNYVNIDTLFDWKKAEDMINNKNG